MAKKKVNAFESAVIEAIKELLRVVALAIIPVLISGLEQGSVDMRTILVVAALAALRFLDKLLHKLGKETKRDRLIKGLTRF